MSSALRRPGEEGLIRGCCLSLIVLLAAIGFAAYLADRAIAAPELGAAPAGPDHGTTELAVAAALAPQLAAELGASPHGAITLSEHDLTVIAAAHNPDPSRYHNLAVRLRDQLLVLTADVSLGPIGTTAVARISVTVDDPPDGRPRLTSQLEELDAGELGLPGWLRDRFADQVMRSTSLSALFGDNAVLNAAASAIECVTVAPSGLRIGVHRAGVAADPGACQS